MGEALSHAETLRRMAAFNRASKEQPKRARVYAAELLGMAPTTFRCWLDKQRAVQEFIPEPQKSQKITSENENSQKPRYRVQALSRAHVSDGPVVRVMAIGDVHTKPGRTTEHLTWIGRHAAATRPDRLVCIGDFLSLDSLSNHPPKGSARDSERPSFVQDLEAGEEGLEAIDREYPEGERDITLGNHEKRAWTAADIDPRRSGEMPLRVHQLFARYRWRAHDYGKYLNIARVRFVHVPLNVMSREYGGKHSENTIGNDLVWSLVWGHDHRGRFKTVYKIGDQNEKINLCNLGTAMPNNVVEDYSVGVTGWTYGTWDLRLRDGLIVSAKFIDMEELRERYA